MASHPYTYGIVLAAFLIALGWLGEPKPSLSAVPAKSEKTVDLSTVRPVMPDRSVPAKRLKGEARKLSKTQEDKPTVGRQKGKPAGSQRIRWETGFQQKPMAKISPPTIIEPKADLSYYGLLEQPQRYDPNRDRRTGRVLNPLTSELLYDHFPELDRNRDGVIDPLERAVGRLGMGRDLSNQHRD